MILLFNLYLSAKRYRVELLPDVKKENKLLIYRTLQSDSITNISL